MRPETRCDPPRRSRTRRFAGIGRIVQVDASGPGRLSVARCIADVDAALAARGIHPIRLRGEGAAPGRDDDTVVPGLGEHCEPDDGQLERLRERIARLAPDVVCLHDGRHARLVHALAQPARSYLFFWHIHDHYPTCLTGLRESTAGDPPACRRRLSMSCLVETARGHCARSAADPAAGGAPTDAAPAAGRFRMPDLFARLKLLESARRADAVLVPSASIREALLAGLPELEPRVHIVPPPVASRPAAPRAAAAPPGIGFHAPLDYAHGLHVLLAAFGRLPPTLRLTVRIAGSETDAGYWAHCRARIAALRHTHPGIEILHLGPLDAAGVEDFYRRTDVLVIARLRGAGPDFAAAEALVRGAAVIATRAGATHEWIRDGRTGLLVPPGDAGALTAALGRLCGDEPLRARLVAAGRWLVGNQFTAHEHVETLAAVVERCRAQRRGPRRWQPAPRPVDARAS